MGETQQSWKSVFRTLKVNLARFFVREFWFLYHSKLLREVYLWTARGTGGNLTRYVVWDFEYYTEVSGKPTWNGTWNWSLVGKCSTGANEDKVVVPDAIFPISIDGTTKLQQVWIWVGWFSACKGSEVVMPFGGTYTQRFVLCKNKFQRRSLFCAKRRGFLDLPLPRMRVFVRRRFQVTGLRSLHVRTLN